MNSRLSNCEKRYKDLGIISMNKFDKKKKINSL